MSQDPVQECFPAGDYTLDSRTGVWTRAGAVFASDDVADELQGLFATVSDVSADSDELRTEAASPRATFCVSSEALNALRPVRHLLAGRVLVIADDYGNTARFAAERAREVVVLADTYPIALTTAARCKGLSNVTVICDVPPLSNPGEFNAAVVRHSCTALSGGVLQWLGNLLRPSGVLLVAAENRLGLATFAGKLDSTLASSDESEGTGRVELDAALQRSGFEHRQFLFLFPDSRSSKTVVTPAILNTLGAEAAALLQSFGAAYTSDSGYRRHFAEPLLWRVLLRNHLAQDLANGFLVVASPSSPTAPMLPEDVGGYGYATNRRRRYQKETLIITGREWRVMRRHLHNDDDEDVPHGPVTQELRDEPYLAGQVYGHILSEIMNRTGWTMNDVVVWAEAYVRFLEKHIRGQRNGRPALPEEFVDCTPLNVMACGERLTPFDLEWRATEPPTLDFVCFRGLLYTFGALVEVAAPGAVADLHVLQMVLTTMQHVGYGVEAADLARFWETETKIQTQVVGEHAAIDQDYWNRTTLQIRNLQGRATEPANGMSGADSYLVQEVVTAERHRLIRAVSEHANEMAAVRRDFSKMLDVLQVELHAARQERENRLQKLAESAQAVQHLQTTIADLRSSLAAATEQAHELRTRLLHVDGEIERLRTENASLLGHSATLAAEAASWRNRERELRARLAETGHETAALKMRLEEAAAHLADLRARNDEFAATIEAHEQALAGLKHRTERAERLQEEAEARATALIAELEGTRAQLGAREQESEALRLEAVAAAEGARAAHASLHEQAQEAARLSHDLRQVRTSMSWRITAPLRGLLDTGINTGIRVIGLLRLSAMRVAPGHRAIFRALVKSGLFDAAYYRARYPDVRSRPVNPLIHYLYAGVFEHRWPNPIFDPQYYLTRAPEAADNPLLHYIRRGHTIGASGHPLFDPEHYRSECGDEINRSGLTAAGHYLQHGERSGRNPHPLFDTAFYLAQEPPGNGPALVRYLSEPPVRNPHALFDTAFYLRSYPDVARAGVNPLEHYVVHGRRGYNPHWLFDTEYYANAVNLTKDELPLQHYVRHGWREGRTPHPLFDPAYYTDTNPEIRQRGIDPLQHYVTIGWRQAKQPHPLFDGAYYAAKHPQTGPGGSHPLQYFLSTGAALGHSPHPLFDTRHYLHQISGINPSQALVHFCQHGRNLRTSPHPLFDTGYYLDRYRDVIDTGMNPLSHYLRFGVSEHRNPHPLFDTSFYLHRYKGELFGMNPLVHYAQHGGELQWSTHPLFDAAFYLQSRPDLRRCGMPALMHYILCSGRESTDPHPLFDTGYYRQQKPQIGSASPLIHYVTQGSHTRNPNRLFDTSYYLASHPEIRQSHQTPLEHYLFHWAEGAVNPHPLFDSQFYLAQRPAFQPWQSPLEHYRTTRPSLCPDPHPEFDTQYYLKQVPDIDKTHLSPLEHYLAIGAAEGLDPNPHFHTLDYVRAHPEIKSAGINPLVHSVLLKTPLPETQDLSETISAGITTEHGGRPTLRLSKLPDRNDFQHPPADKVVLCFTHVVFNPPRAGNEYRFKRLLQHLQQQGYRPIVVFVPIEPASDSMIQRLAFMTPDLIVCRHDGSVSYQLQGDDSIMTSLEGMPVPEMPAGALQEASPPDERSAELIQVDRVFSHDALCAVALHLQRVFRPCVILANYIFMTRFLPFVPADTLKIIDTIDVFSTKARKVMTFDVDDGLSMSTAEERKRLLRAHVILAIQDGERHEFEEIVPERRVVTAGVDFDVEEESRPAPPGKDIVLIASDNPMNVKGLRDFLRFAWPLIAREEPEARLLVAGRVSHTVISPDDRVSLFGPVDDVNELYRRARVVINPAVAGTGLKIKTVEALCHLRPVIGWPNGFDGLDERVAKLCPVAADWFEFATHVVAVLRDSREQWFSDEDARLIRETLSADVVYREFDAILTAFFDTKDVRAVLPRRST